MTHNSQNCEDYDNVCAISKQLTCELEIDLQDQVNMFIESQKLKNSIAKTEPQQENILIAPNLKKMKT